MLEEYQVLSEELHQPWYICDATVKQGGPSKEVAVGLGAAPVQFDHSIR